METLVTGDTDIKYTIKAAKIISGENLNFDYLLSAPVNDIILVN